MKKTLLASLLILSLSVFVYAGELRETWGGIINGDTIETTINLEKGWNLVYGLANPEWLSGGEVSANNIKAIYLYDLTSKEYIRVYPNPEKSKLENIRDDYYLSTSAFWVYSDKSGKSEYFAMKPFSLTERRLSKGWNFVGLTADLGNIQFKDIKGNCRVTRLCAFERQDWDCSVETPDGLNFDTNVLVDHESNYNKGLLMKVAEDCKMGTDTSSGGINPPPIPDDNTSCSSFNYDQTQCIANGCICEGPDCRVCWTRTSETICKDSDGGLNYYVKGKTSSGSNPSYTDYCPTNDVPNTLVEYTCAGSDVTGVVSNHYVCPNGCNNGACIQ